MAAQPFRLTWRVERSDVFNGQVEGGARIIVMGVGGAGSNAVERMINAGVRGVEFVALNSDQQALSRSQAARRVRLGERLTQGLGAGGNPSVGAKAAEESSEEIAVICRDADMVFIAAGMGGGTGTGASPVIAQIAQEAGALTVGVVTKPFAFEGSRRRRIADDGLTTLREHLNTMIIIPNDRVLQVIDKRTTVEASFGVVDDVLRQGIQGISELITRPGLINLDFADVKTVMSESGIALMAIGAARGEDRAMDAARLAMASPLLDLSMYGARGVLFNVTGGSNLSLGEINQAADIIRRAADPEANIIFGAVIDESMEDELRITVIATGFDTARPSTPERPFMAGRGDAAGFGERDTFPSRRSPLRNLDEPGPGGRTRSPDEGTRPDFGTGPSWRPRRID
jgi:cell division protein FtsZ